MVSSSLKPTRLYDFYGKKRWQGLVWVTIRAIHIHRLLYWYERLAWTLFQPVDLRPYQLGFQRWFWCQKIDFLPNALFWDQYLQFWIRCCVYAALYRKDKSLEWSPIVCIRPKFGASSFVSLQKFLCSKLRKFPWKYTAHAHKRKLIHRGWIVAYKSSITGCSFESELISNKSTLMEFQPFSVKT